MPDLNPISWWLKLLALPNESRTKTLAVAFLVSGVCALVVSSAAVILEPLQEANRAAERQARLEAMMAAMPGMADILSESGADRLESVVVDLNKTAVTDIDPAGFDMRAAATDPETSTPIPPEADVAGLGRRTNYAVVHILRSGDALRLVILPISAAGYQSTIHANLALQGDLNTVAGLSIVEQGETPGLGARIEEPAWQALWPGKKLANAEGEIRLSVVRGRATNEYEVDGITGATRTGNAVTEAVQFWLGDFGYGPLLDKLRAGALDQ
ncbi:NADH:ubiquinone reductase (Na(+)-transporting) subunit C [Maritalea mediterranea]|uniref:Na(+)-translocating NADH-quinone reductase subunit C n=1 Tax=Maritalea mediterranea TaxID=2909667 RepID=A0ABS9E6D3_9HYPH|nr:NADH:ubiquinone reductase (Na(+)-transporting) subunit C [Maritalea mediterranea]MCF4098372.1 NADH:ubiquinone reductase (Na(+)-transporting) subunit C [Maritalea mediterranea]